MDRSILVNEFEDMGLSISDDMIDECVILCHTHQISPSDFVGSWIAQCASSQGDANDLSKEKLITLVKSFKAADEYKANNKIYVDTKSNLNESVVLPSTNTPASLKRTPKTNIKIENQISVSDIIDADNLKEENTFTSSGDIACNFGYGNVNKVDSSADVDRICLLEQEQWNNFIFGQVNNQKFEDHVEDIVDFIVKSNNLQFVKRMSDLYYGSDNTEITIFGILKVLKKEMFLCSPRGNIRLDLSEAKQPVLQLFINQILVVTGTSPDTKVFKVRQMYADASLPLSKTLPDFSQGNVNLMVAAGPFFSELSPHGNSLKSLIKKTIELEAKLLILLGPIFESDFGTQLNNKTTENVQKCYDDILESILKPLFSNPKTQNTKLVVFSSWKDAGNYGFYPTPPNNESRLPIVFPNNIFMVSDPSVFSVNNIVIAGNASDTLLGLHGSTVNQTQGEIFEKLCKQMIWQRCLHPSYIANPTVPVDQLLWLDHCTMQQNTPHIILTSSQLRTFIRTVNDCIVVNVGQLVRHNSQKQATLGTYGKIQIAPPKNGCWTPKTNILAEIIHI